MHQDPVVIVSAARTPWARFRATFPIWPPMIWA